MLTLEQQFSLPQQDSSIAPCYIAVGILKERAGLAHERVIRIHKNDDQLFRRLHKAAREIWPLNKRLFSLKSISGFGLYHCHTVSSYHSSIIVDSRTKQTLSEFYTNYKNNRIDLSSKRKWTEWVHKELNNGSVVPEQGRYTLELTLRWSAVKIVLYGLLPVLGSLIVGLAYMQARISNADGDFGTELSVIQTAWGLASYVVGAAGGKSLLCSPEEPFCFIVCI